MPKLKFLVVEDDLFYQTYMNDLLAETDVDIVNASDGEAGLAMAIAELPDLIITDIEIPKIQGFVLFKALRERPDTKDIPVIMMSGKVEKALLDRHSRMSIHVEGCLVRPFSAQVLIDMIRDVVGKDFGFSEVVIEPDDENLLVHPAPVPLCWPRLSPRKEATSSTNPKMVRAAARRPRHPDERALRSKAYRIQETIESTWTGSHDTSR